MQSREADTLRATASFVGPNLSHPVRLAVNRGMTTRDTANFLTTEEALKLAADLLLAVGKASLSPGESNGEVFARAMRAVFILGPD